MRPGLSARESKKTAKPPMVIRQAASMRPGLSARESDGSEETVSLGSLASMRPGLSARESGWTRRF